MHSRESSIKCRFYTRDSSGMIVSEKEVGFYEE
jgi:hypothetical protein